MKTILDITRYVGLLTIVAAALLFLFGAIEIGMTKALTGAGTVVWFGISLVVVGSENRRRS